MITADWKKKKDGSWRVKVTQVLGPHTLEAKAVIHAEDGSTPSPKLFAQAEKSAVDEVNSQLLQEGGVVG